MTCEDFNSFCGALPGTTHAVQWGGSHVWKVGGKIFAIGGWNEGGVRVTFKVRDIAFEVLKTRPLFRPAPYLASRGLTWIQYQGQVGPVDEEVLELLRGSYALIVAKLPRAARAALGGD